MRANKPYPIAELLLHTIQHSQLSEREFVSVLGYRSTNKGLRKLRSWLDTGAGDGEFLRRVASTYGIRIAEICSALEQTIIDLSTEKTTGRLGG